MTAREMIEQEAKNMESGNYESTWEYRDALTHVAEAAAREATKEALHTYWNDGRPLSEVQNEVVAAVLGEAKR